MTPEEESELQENILAELMNAPDSIVPVNLDVFSAMAICASLSLALRHPLNSGATAEITRRFVFGVRDKFNEMGMPYHAKMIELGMDPAHDYEPKKQSI